MGQLKGPREESKNPLTLAFFSIDIIHLTQKVKIKLESLLFRPTYVSSCLFFCFFCSTSIYADCNRFCILTNFTIVGESVFTHYFSRAQQSIFHLMYDV